MAQTLQRSIWIAFWTATALAGCSAGPLDNLPPGMGGLPAGAPARPTTTYQYPAVHDMPPPRSAPTLSEPELLRLEKELAAARDRQVQPEKPPPATKKKPATANTSPNAGTGAGAKGNP